LIGAETIFSHTLLNSKPNLDY